MKVQPFDLLANWCSVFIPFIRLKQIQSMMLSMNILQHQTM